MCAAPGAFGALPKGNKTVNPVLAGSSRRVKQKAWNFNEKDNHISLRNLSSPLLEPSNGEETEFFTFLILNVGGFGIEEAEDELCLSQLWGPEPISTQNLFQIIK